jgi:tetratricopeptide (TPR) repeat protein
MGNLRKIGRSKKKAQGKPRAKQRVVDITNLPDRRAMEGTMFDLFGGREQNSGRQAQEMMYDAWDAPDSRKRIALARQSLELSSNCADAYVLLVEEVANSLEEALELYRKGVEAGERSIGKKAFKEYTEHFWGLLETRPYMRARVGLAVCLWKLGQREEAVEHYQEMLRLNPNDNQGIRYILASCLLELARDEELSTLLKEHKDDASAAWAYTSALLIFRKSGDGKESCKALKEAIKSNKYIPVYLLGKKKLPRQLPDYVGFGDENEAVCYVSDNIGGWKATDGALEWLTTQTK